MICNENIPAFWDCNRPLPTVFILNVHSSDPSEADQKHLFQRTTDHKTSVDGSWL
jgi:hypothetical protein